MYTRITICFSLLVMLASASQAQVVQIPDAGFRQALIKKGVDTNGDGQIQLAEAQKVTKLYLDGGKGVEFSSMEGIKSFTNLVEFGTYEIRMKHADVQGMTSLKRLYLQAGGIESVNIKGCSNLEHLYLTGNRLTSLDISEHRRLTELYVPYNQLTDLVISDYPNLEKIAVKENKISNCRITGCPRLNFLDISKNNIAGRLDLSVFPELVYFSADRNPITAVNITGLSKLESFSCLYCSIVTLNLSGAERLKDLIW
ncbi:hypothetical protein [Chitinophaga sp. YIM B06452]|uniref:leucine-rich repeat domain-containing protein n=1 Tax=Chitinophaga sp. YIM B06452 TaxID=3082158 RepID=UPI0031FF0350